VHVCTFRINCYAVFQTIQSQADWLAIVSVNIALWWKIWILLVYSVTLNDTKPHNGQTKSLSFLVIAIHFIFVFVNSYQTLKQSIHKIKLSIDKIKFKFKQVPTRTYTLKYNHLQKHLIFFILT